MFLSSMTASKHRNLTKHVKRVFIDLIETLGIISQTKEENLTWWPPIVPLTSRRWRLQDVGVPTQVTIFKTSIGSHLWLLVLVPTGHKYYLQLVGGPLVGAHKLHHLQLSNHKILLPTLLPMPCRWHLHCVGSIIGSPECSFHLFFLFSSHKLVSYKTHHRNTLYLTKYCK